MKGIAILGSTGSIGQSALAVVDAHPRELRVVGLAAGGNAARLARQVERYRPSRAALATEQGPQGLIDVATHPDADVVLFASSGTAALDAVLAAIEAGKTIALANKEILVMAGALVMAAAQARGVAVLPVDSEHNAIHQCLHGRRSSEIKRLILTASGGPFRGLPARDLANVSAADALNHPTWRMGPKITVDSATLMNKGLEVIEARWLFAVDAGRIDVLVHPQSIVHSMVELIDGSVIAQLGVTDMRLPIQYAFSYPDRWPAPLPSLDLARAGRLEFEPADTVRFPCLALAFRALRGGAGLPIVLNAANEVAVAAFLDERLAFTGIADVICRAMDAFENEHPVAPLHGLAEVRAIDAWARAFAARAATGVQSTS
ncbi:MAG TPA: 1-deoxy-D-xylulose-5-phosphate reductoisomerase [Vicinamibacterales bacterium]|nr:1-deoxy-D-xylulose-5-phosphate reductoisomerase [Vicinamibacterales bacterium]